MISNFFANSVINNNAQFRAIGSAMSAAIQAVGIVKTGDTGQIDWLTVNRPGINTYAGYEMFRLNDALQSTVPTFIKIRYGIATVATIFTIEVQISTGTNGAGTLTGITTDAIQLRSTVVGDANNNYLCFAAGDTDRLSVGLHIGNNTNVVIGFTVSRTRNSDATASAYATQLLAISNNGGAFQQLLVHGISKYPSTAFTSFTAAVPPGSTTSVYNGEQGLFPVTPKRSWADYPALDIVLYNTTESSAGTILRSTILGSVRQFIALGNNTGATAHVSATGYSAALRYE